MIIFCCRVFCSRIVPLSCSRIDRAIGTVIITRIAVLFSNETVILSHFNIAIFIFIVPFVFAIVTFVIPITKIEGWLNSLGVKLTY